jgi:hypothetical protein
MSRTAILTVGGTVATVATGSLILAGPVLGASASKLHAEAFTAAQTSSTSTSGQSFVISDNDVKGSKQIGADVLFCLATKTHATCHVTFAGKGGLIYGRLVINDSNGSVRGKVTGGTNSFRHAKGTISGQATSRAKVSVTLKYKK